MVVTGTLAIKHTLQSRRRGKHRRAERRPLLESAPFMQLYKLSVQKLPLSPLGQNLVTWPYLAAMEIGYVVLNS